MNVKPGLFISIEGIDGCGKTTQVERLIKRFQNIRLPVAQSCEPSHKSAIGKLLRQEYLSGNHPAADNILIQLLIISDRYELITNPVGGLINAIYDHGVNVITDRHSLSTYVYGTESYKSSHPAYEYLKMINSINTSLIEPDVTILINTSPKIAFDRITSRGDRPSVFETAERLIRLSERYISIATEMNREYSKEGKHNTIYIIDGDGSADSVEDEIWSIIGPIVDDNQWESKKSINKNIFKDFIKTYKEV